MDIMKILNGGVVMNGQTELLHGIHYRSRGRREIRKMKLKEFQNKYHIRRIEFDNVKPVDEIEEYGTDQLICPYCGAVNEYEAESIDEIVRGTPWQCRECEKWFCAEGEFSMETTCTPIENKVLEPFARGSIERAYKHMDECAECGCEWESPFGVVEFTTYKEFAEPLFENERNGEEK